MIHVPVGETGFSSIAEALMVNSTLHRLECVGFASESGLMVDDDAAFATQHCLGHEGGVAAGQGRYGPR